MKCPNCGHEIKSCPECGGILKKRRERILKKSKALYYQCKDCGIEVRVKK